jgi:hypothetical protein
VKRRAFIVGIGSAVAWAVMARAQQPDRVRRIGVLMAGDENDPERKRRLSAVTQALADLGLAVICGWTFAGAAVTPIGYERSRRSWLACSPTSS